ncbi:MAG: Pr6Pr family membrane protein [Jiangellaceae bacterium]
MAPTGARDSTQVDAGVRRARWWHLATFVAAVFGVGLQLWIEFDPAPNPDRPEFSTPIRLWNVLSYFTVWSNILVLVVAYLLWRDPLRRGRVFTVFRLASVVMITLTGVIYALVLAPLWNPTGWQRVADETLHYTVPILAVVSFLVAGPRPRFSTRTLWASVSIPLVYIAYTLIRSPFITYTQDGQTRHWYPYHFLDVDDLGYGRVLINIAGLLLLLLAVAGIFLYLDRKLPERPIRSPAISPAPP